MNLTLDAVQITPDIVLHFLLNCISMHLLEQCVYVLKISHNSQAANENYFLRGVNLTKRKFVEYRNNLHTYFDPCISRIKLKIPKQNSVVN